MKATDYAETYWKDIIAELENPDMRDNFKPALDSLLVALQGEYGEICRQRKISLYGEKAPAIARELNQKWNKICRLYEERYGKEVLKRNFFWEYHVQFYPNRKLVK
jgi:hypothetical protein